MPASGIRGTHDIPLGSHLCLFYQRPKQFLQVTASFLKAGLTENQLCVWILPPPLTVPSALDALSHLGLNGPVLQAAKQPGGTFDVEDSLSRLAALPPLARNLGYSSVRAVGGPGPFVSEACRQAFLCYERHATPIIADLRSSDYVAMRRPTVLRPTCSTS